MRSSPLIAAALFAVLPALAGAAPSPPAPRYTVSKTVALGAPDRWDYVTFDPGSHRVFVAHGDRVSVVDGRSGAILGQVAGFPGGTHGIAISPADGRGYTDDGEAGTVKSFDLRTLKVLKTLPAQPDADGIIFDPASRHVFVADGDSGKLTVVDPKTERVIATIDGGGKLEFLASGGNGKVYVAGAAKRDIVRIDTRTNQADAHWPIPECESPHGLAIDAKSHRLFVSCLNAKLVVVDADRGTQVATLPIGKGSDAAVFDAKRKLVFSSNGGDGSLSVIREDAPDRFTAAATIKTTRTARTMGIDPASGRLYLVAGDVDPASPPGGRPKLAPGSLKLMFLDPAR